jgi:hypothetical protein
MDMATFKSTLNANNWKTCLMAIIFDNSMRWVFDQRERTYNESTHTWEYGEYIPPEQTLIFDDANECIKMKEPFQCRDKTNPNADKWYFYTVRHVENVQAIVFCDESNKEIRPYFDSQMM